MITVKDKKDPLKKMQCQSKLVLCIIGSGYSIYFFATFFFSLSLSIGKRSTLGRGGGVAAATTLQPPFQFLRA